MGKGGPAQGRNEGCHPVPKSDAQNKERVKQCVLGTNVLQKAVSNSKCSETAGEIMQDMLSGNR